MEITIKFRMRRVRLARVLLRVLAPALRRGPGWVKLWLARVLICHVQVTEVWLNHGWRRVPIDPSEVVLA